MKENKIFNPEEKVRIKFNHDNRWVEGYVKYNDNTFMRVDITGESYDKMEYDPSKPVIIPINSIKVIELIEDKAGEGE